MRRGTKPSKAKVESERLAAPKSPKSEGSRVRDLEKRLAEALKRETEGLKREAEAQEQQAATAEILRVISSSPTDVQPVFDTIVRNAVRLSGASWGVVTRVEAGLITFVAHHNLDANVLARMRRTWPRTVDDRGPTAGVVARGELFRVADLEAEDYGLLPEAAAEFRARGIRSMLVVPMVREGHVVGTINLTHQAVGAFSDADVALITTFAAQAVIAIENVRLFKKLEEKNTAVTAAHAQVIETLEQQTATSEILRVIASSPTEVQPVFDAIAKSAVQLTDAVMATVYEFDGSMIHLRVLMPSDWPHANDFQANFPRPPAPDFAAGRVILEPAVLHRADLQHDPDTPELTREWARLMGLRSVLWVPMLREREPIGVVGVVRRESGFFSDEQVRLLKTFADQAVIAIENVRLFKELEEKNRALAQAHEHVTEALDRQTATSEILRVISSSPMDVQPIFDAIVRSASRLCGGEWAIVTRYDGELLHLAAQHNPRPGSADAASRLFPHVPQYERSITARALLDSAVVHVSDVETEDLEPSTREQYRRIRLRAVVAVPMIHEGRPIGVVAVSRETPGPFSDRQIDLLRTFADQAVIAIENVRLFKELEARNRDLTATGEILQVISRSPTDAQPVFDTIADNAVRLFRPWSVAVYRFDGEFMHVAAVRGGLPGSEQHLREQGGRRPTREVMAGRCVIDRAVIHVPDFDTDPEVPTAAREIARVRGFRATISVPMLRDGEPIGVISVSRAEAGAFSHAEISLLQTFADQAVIAIENVRLFKELEARTADLTRSVGQLTALGEVGRAVSSTLDLETVLNTIVSRAVQLSGLDGGVVFEYDENAEEFVQRAMTETGEALAEARRTTRIRKGEGVLGRTAITLEPVQVVDIAVPGAYEGRLRETLIDSGIRAILAVPMVHQGRLIGCLGVTRNRPGDFSAETIELLRTFATQSALAIQNARLFREIEQKSRELEAASRHKSEFLANMSHELRTPLNAIIGFSEVLGERMFGELNEKQDEYLKDIHASGQHLLSLINDILDLSKIEAGRMELEVTAFDLPIAIDNALTLVRERAARRSIALHTSVNEQLGQIEGDERKIRQVLLNLLSNAIKFTPEGGRIHVEARAVNESIEVSVTDTGVGIAPGDQEAVFEEFRQVGTADKKVEGTGLGLALSRKFIELHGGKILVKSQVGAGSTFTFTVPVRRGE